MLKEKKNGFWLNNSYQFKSSRSKSLADTNHAIGVKNEGFSELVDGPRMWEKKL